MQKGALLNIKSWQAPRRNLISSRCRLIRHGHRDNITAASNPPGVSPSVPTLRRASTADLSTIQKAVLREKMNPLGLDVTRFVIAESSGGEISGFGQLAPLDGSASSGSQRLELKSLIVEPEHRNEGVGKALLRELVARARDSEIYLTTLASTAPFYESANFAVLSSAQIPRSLLFEYYCGTVVARLAAQQRLIVMRRPPGDDGDIHA